MKLRYVFIAMIAIIIAGKALPALQSMLTLPLIICLLLFVALLIRNIFRAIKGVVTGTPQGGDYRGEARKACEKVTPKRKQDTTPPWEE